MSSYRSGPGLSVCCMGSEKNKDLREPGSQSDAQPSQGKRMELAAGRRVEGATCLYPVKGAIVGVG